MRKKRLNVLTNRTGSVIFGPNQNNISPSIFTKHVMSELLTDNTNYSPSYSIVAQLARNCSFGGKIAHVWRGNCGKLSSEAQEEFEIRISCVSCGVGNNAAISAQRSPLLVTAVTENQREIHKISFPPVERNAETPKILDTCSFQHKLISVDTATWRLFGYPCLLT